MNYQLTNLEESIKILYQSLSITKPSEIDMWHFARTFDIWIEFEEYESQLIQAGSLYTICLNSRRTIEEQWEDFGHEFGHAVMHVGSQHKLKVFFKDLQERQANNFMYHFCVPTFMLLKYNLTNYINVNDGVDFVADTFNVTKEFAKKRLVHYRNQWAQAKSDATHRKYMESRYRKAPPYSDETNIILARALEFKSAKRKEDHQCQFNI
jgi:Zn-dependent peptidase ImmA (M78 family)